MRLREATNGTELKRLQLLYDNVADELNSANEDLNKEPGILKARVHTLMNEVNRAKTGEAERLGCWHLRLGLQNPSLDPAMARLVEEITEFDIHPSDTNAVAVTTPGTVKTTASKKANDGNDAEKSDKEPAAEELVSGPKDHWIQPSFSKAVFTRDGGEDDEMDTTH